jgi:hypothetical protein
MSSYRQKKKARSATCISGTELSPCSVLKAAAAGCTHRASARTHINYTTTNPNNKTDYNNSYWAVYTNKTAQQQGALLHVIDAEFVVYAT